MPAVELISRLCLATGVGLIIGFEREARGHEPGLRTHALVALGAALFSVAGAYGFSDTDSTSTIIASSVAATTARYRNLVFSVRSVASTAAAASARSTLPTTTPSTRGLGSDRSASKCGFGTNRSYAPALGDSRQGQKSFGSP